MASNEEIKIVINADDKASGVLNDVGKTATGLSGVLGGVAKVAGIAVVAGFAALTAEAFRAVRAFGEAQVSSEKLEHAVLGVSHGTQQQVEDIKALTAALQRKGVVDGDALNSGVAQLSTFGLSTKMVKELIPALADLTINQAGVNASTQDYESSANVMAKALNGQFGILEKSGIRFTETQQKMIQFGTESERSAALIEGFNQNLKFTNEGAMNTFEGKLVNLQNAFGELEETIGSVLITALTPFVTKLSEFASSEGVATALEKISISLETFINNMIHGIETLADWGKSIDQFVDRLMTQLKPAFDSIWMVIQTLLLPMFQELWRVIKEELWPAIQDLWAALQPFLPLLEQFAKLVGIAVVAALLLFVAAITSVLTFGAQLLTWLAKMATFISEEVLAIWKSFEEKIIAVVNAFKQVIEFAKKAADAISNFSLKGAASSITKSLGFRANGGSVTAGNPYIVGERGPELFIPNGSGSIIPNNRVGGASAGMPNIYITGTFLSEDAAMRMAEMVGDRLKLQLRI